MLTDAAESFPLHIMLVAQCVTGPGCVGLLARHQEGVAHALRVHELSICIEWGLGCALKHCSTRMLHIAAPRPRGGARTARQPSKGLGLG